MKKVIANVLVAGFLLSMLSIGSFAVEPKACPHAIEWRTTNTMHTTPLNDFASDLCHVDYVSQEGVCTRCGDHFTRELEGRWEKHKYPSNGGYCIFKKYGCHMSSFDVRMGEAGE